MVYLGLPINSMVIFHGRLLVITRGYTLSCVSSKTACPAAQVYCSTAATMLWDFPTVRSMNCASVSLGARIARWCPRTVAKLVAVELARLTSYVVIICDYKILQTIAGYAGWSCKTTYNWGCKWCSWWSVFFYHEAWGLEHGGLMFEPCVRAIDDTNLGPWHIPCTI